MRAALDIHRDLLAVDVPHEVVRLPSGVASGDDLPQALGLPPARCVVVRCYVTDRGIVAVATTAGSVADPAAVMLAVGAQTLRVATADEVSTATDYAAGLVSPLGLPAEVPLLADAALTSADVLYCPAGEAGLALGIRSVDLLATTRARVLPLGPLPLPRTATDRLLGGDLRRGGGRPSGFGRPAADGDRSSDGGRRNRGRPAG